MDQPGRKDFFISYNQADKAWAEWIAWELEAKGYTSVLQVWDFRPGRNFVLEMHEAAQKAGRTLAVLSPDYLNARFTQPEWAAAFAQDPTGAKGILLPVRIRECKPDGLLGPLIYIDLVGLEEAAARETLLAGVKETRAKPSAAPGFPGAAAPEAPRFPGSMPPIWNVPHPRNPNFTGREQLLADLRKSLQEGKTAALTALYGLGGVGKTQLALEYAYRFAADYDLVWWVRAEDPEARAANYAGLAGALGLPEREAVEQEVRVDAVRRSLEHRDKWLLIFDNAGEVQDLQDYRPRGGGGHVLITSRNPVWREAARPLDIRVWEPPESVNFLLKRTGREENPSAEDKAAAAELARELGDLPLALEQAGAYIEECGGSIAHYLELFKAQRRELLGQGQGTPDYPESVATTWELSFQKVKQQAPAAADLLNLCAFLAPDDIPRELLAQGAAELPKGLARVIKDPLALDKALAALRRYALMEIAADALAVHRLVQAVARDRLGKRAREKWAGAAVALVNATLSEDVDTNLETWPWYARLLPQALAAAGQAEALGAARPAAGRVLNQVGFYLQIRAEFQAAKSAYGRALALDEAAFGPNHPQVAIRVNNLGRVLQDLGDLQGAKAYMERALGIDEAAFGPKHPKVAIRVNNLGSVLRDLGDLAGARAHLERALGICRQFLGEEHPKTQIVKGNLARLPAESGSGKKSKK
jgi:tetratricopeptide (TPR) repeat protein